MPRAATRRRAPRPSGDDRLLENAIDQFGRRGLEGASTRAIAAAAGAPMSSIAYHFGGKEGLYLAAARHIAGAIAGHLEAAVAAASEAGALTPDEALSAILAAVDAFLVLLLSPQTEPWARFIVREQLDPTEAFDVLWGEFMGPASARLVALVDRAGAGRWDEAQSRLTWITILGQLIVFRVARAAARRVMGWEAIGADEAAAIRHTVHANVRALFASPREDSPREDSPLEDSPSEDPS